MPGVFQTALARMRADAAVGTVGLWPTRKRGFERFARMGLPSPRDEEWRYLDLRGLRERDFTIDSSPLVLESAPLEQSLLPQLDARTVVLVNGRFDPHHSDLGENEDGVTVTSIRRAVDSQHAVLAKHLGTLTDVDAPFLALNDAGFVGGAFVHVAAGARASRPIHVLSFSTPGIEPHLLQPRVLIVADEDSEVDVVEHHVGTEGHSLLRNSVTEIVAGERAKVRHVQLVRESPSSYHFSSLCIRQEAESEVTAHSILLGGRIARHDVRHELAGPGATGRLRALTVAGDEERFETWVRMNHAAPGCRSRQLVKGIAEDRGHAIFTGRIVVDKAGQQTDAQQTCRNLLLDPRARVRAQPQLEIHADDVRCTHGATTGQLDEQALFYLRSRGISEADARAMLLRGFAAEPLSDLAVPGLCDYIMSQVLGKLGLGADAVGTTLDLAEAAS